MSELSHVAMGQCLYCGGDDGTIILDRRLKRGNLPPRVCATKEPCAECKKLMEMGIMFIVVRDGESGDNPYRTGQLYVLTEEACERMIQPKELLQDILRKRMIYIEESTASALGMGDIEPTYKEMPDAT